MKNGKEHKTGGWHAGQVTTFVKLFTQHNPVRVWEVLSNELRRGLVDSTILGIVFSQDRIDSGGSIVINDIRYLRQEFVRKLRERGYTLDDGLD